MLALLGKNEYGNDWNKSITPAVCVHGFVGKLADGTVATVQTLPFSMRCWGCGSGSKGSYNRSHIQFEICEDGMEDPAYLEAAWREAVSFCAHLCSTYRIPVSAIRSHAESFRDGYASNHGDPDHWFKRFAAPWTRSALMLPRSLQVEARRPARCSAAMAFPTRPWPISRHTVMPTRS